MRSKAAIYNVISSNSLEIKALSYVDYENSSILGFRR